MGDTEAELVFSQLCAGSTHRSPSSSYFKYPRLSSAGWTVSCLTSSWLMQAGISCLAVLLVGRFICGAMICMTFDDVLDLLQWASISLSCVPSVVLCDAGSGTTMMESIAIRYSWKTCPSESDRVGISGILFPRGRPRCDCNCQVDVCEQPGGRCAAPEGYPRALVTYQKSNRDGHDYEAVWCARCPRRQVRHISIFATSALPNPMINLSRCIHC